MKNAYATNWVLRELSFERQKPLAIAYKSRNLDCCYRLDIVVENAIIVELKSCEKIEPIHEENKKRTLSDLCGSAVNYYEIASRESRNSATVCPRSCFAFLLLKTRNLLTQIARKRTCFSGANLCERRNSWNSGKTPFDPICKIPLAIPSWLLLVIFDHMPTQVKYLVCFCLILKKCY